MIERGAPRGDAGEALGQLPHRRHQLLCTALEAADRQLLDPVVLAGQRLLGPLSVAPGGLGESLGRGQVAVEHGAHAAQGVRVPDVRGHPQLLGQLCISGQLAVHPGDVAELEE